MVLLCTNFVTVAQSTRIAILDFENLSGIAKYDGLGKAMSSMLISDIEANVSPKRLQLVERAQIQKVLKEQNFQASGSVNKSTAVQAGKILGVSYLLVGDVYILNDQLIINARLTNTETGDIVFSKKQEGKNVSWLTLKTNIAKDIALSLSQPFIEPTIPDKEISVATITTFGNAVAAKDSGNVQMAETLSSTVIDFNPEFRYVDDLKKEIDSLKKQVSQNTKDIEVLNKSGGRVIGAASFSENVINLTNGLTIISEQRRIVKELITKFPEEMASAMDNGGMSIHPQIAHSNFDENKFLDEVRFLNELKLLFSVRNNVCSKYISDRLSYCSGYFGVFATEKYSGTNHVQKIELCSQLLKSLIELSKDYEDSNAEIREDFRISFSKVLEGLLPLSNYMYRGYNRYSGEFEDHEKYTSSVLLFHELLKLDAFNEFNKQLFKLADYDSNYPLEFYSNCFLLCDHMYGYTTLLRNCSYDRKMEINFSSICYGKNGKNGNFYIWDSRDITKSADTESERTEMFNRAFSIASDRISINQSFFSNCCGLEVDLESKSLTYLSDLYSKSVKAGMAKTGELPSEGWYGGNRFVLLYKNSDDSKYRWMIVTP